MLFGYLNAPCERWTDDVQSFTPPPECFSFDRPLLLATELHVAGAMAFASTFGFGGMSLVEWALVQTLDSAGARARAEAVDDLGPPSGVPSK